MRQDPLTQIMESWDQQYVMGAARSVGTATVFGIVIALGVWLAALVGSLATYFLAIIPGPDAVGVVVIGGVFGWFPGCILGAMIALLLAWWRWPPPPKKEEVDA